MAETISDARILALFTRGRWIDLELREGRRLRPFEIAKRIGIKTFQLQALFDDRPTGTRARAKLLAFNDLRESDLANRPGFALPAADDPRSGAPGSWSGTSGTGAYAQVAAKVNAYAPKRVPDRGPGQRGAA